jgi:trehalose-phosphatase
LGAGRAEGVEQKLQRDKEVRIERHRGGRRRHQDRRRSRDSRGQDTTSVAAHFRLVSEEESPKIKEIVDTVLAEHPDELKVTPGKMVYEIQPKLDWDKGKAVLYLLEALDLGGDDAVPMYLGDDITDEHAFETLAGRGISIFVGRADDPEVAGRTTAADYVLHTLEEVERFLNTLAR